MQYKATDYKILDTLCKPVLIASPIYSESHQISDFIIDYVNPSYCRMTQNVAGKGDKYSEIKTRLPEIIDWYDLACKTILQGICSEAVYHSPFTNAWYQINIDRTENGLCFLTMANISTIKQQEQELRFLSYNDSLTGLPNRLCFNKFYTKALDYAFRSGSCFGIMIIDIDNMKMINDTTGYVAGDAILKNSAKILEKFKRKNIRPFRLGDDEFILLVTDITSRDEMANICDAVYEMFQLSDISISAGIAISPDDSSDGSTLLKYADLAMHAAKHSGKNNIVFFQENMYNSFLYQTMLQKKIVNATEKRCFELYFQPQFNIRTNILRGFEALLRWHDTTLGWITPDEFIPVAEETRVIIPLGLWVLETAIATLKQWQVDYDFQGIMSVNVSPTQLKKSDFIEKLTSLMGEYQIKKGTLEIEITEGIFIDNIQPIIKVLTQIQDLGVLISLDDFGTGYSSFRYLQFLPLNTLKLDKSFIEHIDTPNSVETNIADSIISMVTKLGLDTIAEGVERTNQLDILKSMNCQNMQGFLRGKPMDKYHCDAVLNGDMTALVRIGNEPLDKILIHEPR